MAFFFSLRGKANASVSPIDVTPAVRDPQAVRFEEASLNATAVTEQMFYDGWLVRWAAGPFKRMRSVNVIGAPVTSFEERLAFAKRFYARRSLPLVFRVTSVSADPRLDKLLADHGFDLHGETLVLQRPLAQLEADHAPLRYEPVALTAFAQTAGALRDSNAAEIAAHQKRLHTISQETVAMLAWTPSGDCAGAALAVLEDKLVGLFDVVINPDYRRRGFGRAMAVQLLRRAQSMGAQHAYLQVETANEAARKLYEKIGFIDSYRYWYRSMTPTVVPSITSPK